MARTCRVEDRDHGDRSEVVDHRQRQQEGAQGHRQPATGHSQHRQRERDVRGHRDPQPLGSPSVAEG